MRARARLPRPLVPESRSDAERLSWAAFSDRALLLLMAPALGAALIVAAIGDLGYNVTALASLLLACVVIAGALTRVALHSGRPAVYLVIRSVVMGALLIAALHETGGPGSPLWPLFVLHTQFAAVALPRSAAIAVASALCLGAVTLLGLEHAGWVPLAGDARPPVDVVAFRALVILAVVAPGLTTLRWMLGRSTHRRAVLSAANVGLRENAGRSRALLTVVTSFSSSARLAEALDEALVILGRAVDARFAIILMVERSAANWSPLRLIDMEEGVLDVDDALLREVVRRGPGPMEEALETLRPVIVEDVLALGDDHPLRPVADAYGMRSCVLLPLIRPAEGTALGVLTLSYTSAGRLEPSDVEFLQTAAAAFSAALTHAVLIEELLSLNESLEARVAERTAELTSAQEQLLRAGRLTAMGELAAGVAHELNTPLGTITGYTQFAEERLSTMPAVEDVARYLGIVRTEAGRCATIVRNLLQFTRASAADMAPVDLEETVRYAVDLVRHHLEMNHVRIDLSFEPELPPLRARRDELVQVFTNLMINAQQAMPAGGVLRIAATAAPGAQELAITFADTGGGIPPEHVNRIFEPFFTTKPAGQGTGLGLASSYSIVQQHGGVLSVASTGGGGTTMRILLPYERAAKSEPRSEVA